MMIGMVVAASSLPVTDSNNGDVAQPIRRSRRRPAGTRKASGSSPKLLGKLRTSFATGNQLKVSQSLLNSKPATQVQPLAQSAPKIQPQPTQPAPDLNILDQVITEAEANQQVNVAPAPPLPNQIPQLPNLAADHRQQLGVVAQATPAAATQATNALQEAQAATYGTPAKENLVSAGPDQPGVEAATGMQYVEQERSPELTPEVAEYLQHVENHADQAPLEIVVGEDQQQVPAATNYPKQSVVVLPITQEIEKEGIKQSPKQSLRWLVEWSHKLMKKFSGKIIYRQVEK
jgi:hypothetical protein